METIHVTPPELDESVAQPPADLLERLQTDIATAGGEMMPDPALDGAIGATMFDMPGSEDNSIIVLLSKDKMQLAPSQSLVRITSRSSGDGRSYLGIITAGPFAEPDSLRADSHLLVTVTTQGGIYLPPHHGRVQVSILGEELSDGTLVPPRLRPLPNSPVFVLSSEESAKLLKAEGDIRLGLAVGYQNVVVGIPSEQKAVLPRHLAILGTTGGGKSTTVAGLVQQAQAANMAVIVLDVEGEYTYLNEPTSDGRMLSALAERGLTHGGIPVDRMSLYHLVGRDTTNPRHPHRAEFSLQFARLSPYAIAEMTGMNEAQADRFHFAYDFAKAVMREVGIFPEKDKGRDEIEKQERILLRVDEFERGHPRMTLSLLLDIVSWCHALVSKTQYEPYNAKLKGETGQAALRKHIDREKMPGSASSWGKVKSLLWRLHRLKVFDRHLPNSKGPRFIDYRRLIAPGQVSIVDLSDAGLTELANFAIADLLRGVHEAQDSAYRTYEKEKEKGSNPARPSRVIIIIEEAHEFLSAERIDRMNTLFEQVARIAKRGRKRWLGLAFVTQLPQQLPRQLFGLCNSYILHKITDALVVQTLRKTLSGIDDGLWDRLTGLAPGQAIASFPHLARPLLVSVDPTPAKLRLID
jgi:DNA helicase HerA-like ATPase